MFAALLVAGAALRVVTQLAYRPALIFYDSSSYLHNALALFPQPDRPIGYPLLLRAVLEIGTLRWVAAAQHAMGLVAAGILYATLTRLRLPAWLAALGAAPLLLDGYQLNIEQWIMSDTLFELLLVVAFAFLLWNRSPGLLACLAAAALLGFAVWVRLAGAAMIVPAIVIILGTRRPWRRKLARALLAAAVFALPLAGYAGWFDAVWGKFAMSEATSRFLYARVATFADCSVIRPPGDERALCPTTRPGERRLPTNCYAWCAASPYARYVPPPGRDKDALVKRFAEDAILRQPLDYAGTVLADFGHGFEPGRPVGGLDGGFGYWRFTVRYPQAAPPGVPAEQARVFRSAPPGVDPDLSRFLVDYQGIVYTPGPALALGLAAGLAAAAGLGRARRSGLRIACLGLCLAGLAVTFPAYLTSEFDWRYELPLLFCYWPGGLVAAYALSGRAQRDHRPDDRCGPADDGLNPQESGGSGSATALA